MILSGRITFKNMFDSCVAGWPEVSVKMFSKFINSMIWKQNKFLDSWKFYV